MENAPAINANWLRNNAIIKKASLLPRTSSVRKFNSCAARPWMNTNDDH